MSHLFVSVGNWISIIGFGICFVYCIVLVVLAVIKKHKAKKEINAQSKKGNQDESKKTSK